MKRSTSKKSTDSKDKSDSDLSAGKVKSRSTKSLVSSKDRTHILKSGAAPPRVNRRVKHYEKLTIARQAAYATESARRDDEGKKAKSRERSFGELSNISSSTLDREASRDALTTPESLISPPASRGGSRQSSRVPSRTGAHQPSRHISRAPSDATLGAAANPFGTPGAFSGGSILPASHFMGAGLEDPKVPRRTRTGSELWSRLRELWYSRVDAAPAFKRSAHPVLQAIGHMLGGVKGDLANRIYRPGGYRGTLVECTTLDGLLIWRQVTKYVKDFDESQIDDALQHMVKERGIVLWKDEDETVDSQDLEEDKEGTESTPYWQQGNLYMYTSENLAARISLKADPDIKAVVKKWWILADNKGKGFITEDRYCQLSMCVYKALMPVYNDIEARTVAINEWRADVGEFEDTMDEKVFLNSIFEIADLWCASIDKAEYLFFLRILFRLVSKPDGSDFKDVDEIESQADGSHMPNFADYQAADTSLVAPQTGSRLRGSSNPDDGGDVPVGPEQMPGAMKFLGDFYSNQAVHPALAHDTTSVDSLLSFLPPEDGLSYMKMFDSLELKTVGNVASLVRADVDQFPQKEALKNLEHALHAYRITVTPAPPEPLRNALPVGDSVSAEGTSNGLGISRDDVADEVGLRRERKDSMDSVDLQFSSSQTGWEASILDDVRSSVLSSQQTFDSGLLSGEDALRQFSASSAGDPAVLIRRLSHHSDTEDLLLDANFDTRSQASSSSIAKANGEDKPRRRRRRKTKTRKTSVESMDAPSIEPLTKLLPKWGELFDKGGLEKVGELSILSPDEVKSLLMVPESVLVSLGNILETGDDIFNPENQTVDINSDWELSDVDNAQSTRELLKTPDLDDTTANNPICNLALRYKDAPIDRLLPFLQSTRNWWDDFDAAEIEVIGDLAKPGKASLFGAELQVGLSQFVTHVSGIETKLKQLCSILPETDITELFPKLPATTNWRSLFRKQNISKIADLVTFDPTFSEAGVLVEGLISLVGAHVMFPKTAGSNVQLRTVVDMLPGSAIQDLLVRKEITKLHHLNVLTADDLRKLSQNELDFFLEVMDQVVIGSQDEDVQSFYRLLRSVANPEVYGNPSVTGLVSEDTFHLKFSSSPPRMDNFSSATRSRLGSAAIMPSESDPILYSRLSKNSNPISRLRPFLPEQYRSSIDRFEEVGLTCLGHVAGLHGAELAVGMAEFGFDVTEAHIIKVFRRALQGLVKSGNARESYATLANAATLDNQTVFTSRQSFQKWAPHYEPNTELKTVDMMSNLTQGLATDYNARGRRPQSSIPTDSGRAGTPASLNGSVGSVDSPRRRMTMSMSTSNAPGPGTPTSGRQRHNSFAPRPLGGDTLMPRRPSMQLPRRPKSPRFLNDGEEPVGDRPRRRSMRVSKSDYGSLSPLNMLQQNRSATSLESDVDGISDAGSNISADSGGKGKGRSPRMARANFQVPAVTTGGSGSSSTPVRRRAKVMRQSRSVHNVRYSSHSDVNSGDNNGFVYSPASPSLAEGSPFTDTANDSTGSGKSDMSTRSAQPPRRVLRHNHTTLGVTRRARSRSVSPQPEMQTPPLMRPKSGRPPDALSNHTQGSNSSLGTSINTPSAHRRSSSNLNRSVNINILPPAVRTDDREGGALRRSTDGGAYLPPIKSPRN